MTEGEIREIEIDALPAEALKLKNSGYRLVQMCVNRRIGPGFSANLFFWDWTGLCTLGGCWYIRRMRS